MGDWLEVVVRSSKTDQEGRGVALYAGPETARLARRWLKKTRIADGPLFRPVNKGGWVAGTRLSDRSMRDIVKRRAADAGIEGRVSGHSLRIGAGAVAARRRRHDAGTDDGGPLEARRDDGALHQNPGRGGRSGGAAALRRRAAEEADAAPAQHDSPEDGARVETRPKGMETHYADGERTAKNSCTARNRRDSFLKSGFAEPIVTY